MMLKTCLATGILCLLFASCSTMNQIFQPASRQENLIETNRSISLSATGAVNIAASTIKADFSNCTEDVCIDKPAIEGNFFGRTANVLEHVLPIQFKYAVMLNSTVESVSNLILYNTINEWYGTRYRYGGTTRHGIDCSAFMQVLAMYGFGLTLPRTAHEQYRIMDRVASADLQEGDFVFFNTRGGISHVGMYLKNNKFVHSCSSHGVMISDLGDSYWSGKFIGGRRYNADIAKAN